VSQVELRRSLSLPVLVLYGLGNILGAGIYALVGAVAGHAGMLTPLAFLIAALLAAFSAASYAELAGRFPRSAGAALYVEQGLGRRWLSVLVGLLVAAVGVVSPAVLFNGFAGYLQVFVTVPEGVAVTLAVLVIGAVAAWGITESALAASLMTLLEIGGLCVILWVAGDRLGALPQAVGNATAGLDGAAAGGVLVGAVIAFYAFLGFEDMANLAEEVRRPRRDVPLAMLLTLGVATLLYLGVAGVAVLSVPPEELAASGAPLALVYQRTTGQAPGFIAVISLFAVVNGALVQIIMATRVLYGMAREGWLSPGVGSFLGRVHPRTRTPLRGTLLVVAGVLVLALWLPMETLAEATSVLVLCMFVLVNLALWRVKRKGLAAGNGLRVPSWVPALGCVISAGFLAFELVGRLAGLRP
jgi:APA family basic amino acid/polyamine antiporter